MVAYNFQAQFADAVESGQKRQTVRAPRKDNRHAKQGDRLQLYTGLRTKSVRKLITPDPICTLSKPLEISTSAVIIYGWGRPHPDHFASQDGFTIFDALLSWFEGTHGLPFEGQLIKWGH